MKHKTAQTRDLTQGPVTESILRFALPLLGASLVQQLYHTVDLLFVGNILGTGAQAAVGASSLLVTCLVGFFGGMAVGVNVVLANLFGAGKAADARRAIHTAVALSLLGGVVLAGIGYLCAPFYIDWIGTPQKIVYSAVSYLRIYLLSLPAIVIFNMGSGVIRAMGDTRAPLLVQLIGGLSNVAADALFIKYLQWGIDGAAFATLCAQGVTAILVLLVLSRMEEPYRLHLRSIRLHRDLVKRIVVIGVPAGLQALLITLSNVFVQAQINTFDTAAIAAFTDYFEVELLLYLPIVAIGQAATTFVGQNTGAKQPERAQAGVQKCLFIGITMTVISTILILPFGKWAFWLLNKDPDVIADGVQIITITFPFYWIYVILEVYGASIRGRGNATVPMVIILSNICVLRTALLYLLAFLWHDIRAIAVAYPITWASTALCMYAYDRHSRKALVQSKPNAPQVSGRDIPGQAAQAVEN